eukprot:5683932-Amphidinium_carterae.2
MTKLAHGEHGEHPPEEGTTVCICDGARRQTLLDNAWKGPQIVGGSFQARAQGRKRGTGVDRKRTEAVTKWSEDAGAKSSHIGAWRRYEWMHLWQANSGHFSNCR